MTLAQSRETSRLHLLGFKPTGMNAIAFPNPYSLGSSPRPSSRGRSVTAGKEMRANQRPGLIRALTTL